MANDESGRTKITVVFGPEDQDLLRELDEEVHRRRMAGDRSANRSVLILERLKPPQRARAKSR